MKWYELIILLISVSNNFQNDWASLFYPTKIQIITVNRISMQNYYFSIWIDVNWL